MKLFIFTCFFTLFVMSFAKPHDRGCIYVFGKCYSECPEGTHSYTPNYSDPWHWEPTCEEPSPKLQNTSIFDFSACYCDPPSVRNTVTQKCVTLEKCSDGDIAKKEE